MITRSEPSSARKKSRMEEWTKSACALCHHCSADQTMLRLVDVPVPMDVCQRVVRNLRRLRKERSFTQEAFATDSGFDRAYISGVERGVRNPSVLVLARLAEALGVEVAEFFDLVRAASHVQAQRQAR